jgi:DNA primase
MPGIDFRVVQSQVPIEFVLESLRFVVLRRRGDELRGPCPLDDCHRGVPGRDYAFAANRRKGVFRCFRCGRRGNVLDLWAQANRIGVYQAALELCEKLRLDVPRLVAPQRIVRPIRRRA